MREYTYYWSINSITGELCVSTNVDRVTGHSHDYHVIRAMNINEAWSRARAAQNKLYTLNGLPKFV